jgi:hypothetical protein
MALTKVTGQVINNSTDLVVGVTTVGGGVSAVDGFFSGIVTAVGDASFSGNVSVAGTLTYEDVTNIDAVGLVTARNGIVVGSGITLSKDGDGFFTGIVTATSFVGSGSGLTGVASTDNIRTNTNATFLQNINVSGTVTATSYAGSGANLTNLPAANLTGTLPAIDGSNLTGIEAGIQTSNAASMSGITTVLDLSKDDFKITVSGITTVDVRGGSEGNSHTLRIHNSGITTVGFSTYFLFPSGAAPIIPTADGTISLISFTVDRQGAVGLATQLLAGSSVNFS